MCGRYVLGRDTEQVAASFGVDAVDPDVAAPGYNVAPTRSVPVVVDRAGADGRLERLLRTCRWGLVPSWATDPSGGAKMINARAETVATRPAFRVALARRRCLVPADGWYEWATGLHGPGRTPFYLTRPDGAPLAFAGLYEVWSDGSQRLVTCAIVTTAAIGQLTRIHHRMPLLLAPDRWSGWLDPGTSTPVLDPPDADLVASLELRPVGPAVGNVRNQGPELLAPLDAPVGQQALEL